MAPAVLESAKMPAVNRIEIASGYDNRHGTRFAAVPILFAGTIMADMSPPPAPTDLDFHFSGFHNLMPHRIDSVLLVCSLYESFILEEEGLVHELVTAEFMDLNLSTPPRIRRVTSAGEAVKQLAEQPVDLVIAMTRLGGMGVAEFAIRCKQVKPEVPFAALVDTPYELSRNPALRAAEAIDRVFLWNGDAQILLAIHKLFEDSINVDHDTRVGDVRVIILVENSVRFYSFYLPLIYTELMKLTHSLMREGINRMQRILRMRARPKVLLAATYEEALRLYERYSGNLLGVISDIRFPRDGTLDPAAGLDLARRVKKDSPYLPVLLQSSDSSLRADADAINAHFVDKNSGRLVEELRSFLSNSLGFGEFVFTLPDGREIGRAADLLQFQAALEVIPVESLEFHGKHNHFSNWLMARSEFEMAARIRPKRIEDFGGSVEGVRRYLIDTLSEFRQRVHGGLIADFTPSSFDDFTTFTRMSRGSLGGKGRGLAFIHALLERHRLRERFENVIITVPRSTVVGTEGFDEFIELNKLRGTSGDHVDDIAIAQRFRAADLPRSILPDLAALLRVARYPLAVRSSSLLEDSQDRPFAGIYSTYMIPNNHPDLDVRLHELSDAIKLVYASTHFRAARHYLQATGHHHGEERMAVIIQEVVGSSHGDRFYPTFAGVARSYNFYPTADMTPAEGVAYVALGLGRQVVSGGECLMFSPAHPQVLPQFATTKEFLKHSQRSFYALNLRGGEVALAVDEGSNLLHEGLDVAERDGALDYLGSVYSPENDAIYDGIHRAGPRLVSFAHVLKSDVFPLAEILRLLLDIGGEGMGCPIEIEFAVDLHRRPMRFGFLQIRPVHYDEEQTEVEVQAIERDNVVCYSDRSLGNGRIRGLRDIIYVRPESFDAGRSKQIAREIGEINERLRNRGDYCLLIGPGRWGTSDPWLGVPVEWDQISQARVIVETTLEGFLITPSQGAHFFQNLTSLGIGYLAIDPSADQGTIDWTWLAQQPAAYEGPFSRHIRLERPLGVRLDGRTRRGLVMRPELADQDGTG